MKMKIKIRRLKPKTAEKYKQKTGYKAISQKIT